MEIRMEILGLFDHTHNKGRVSEQTNKMRTKPVPQHIAQNSCGHRGTTDTEGQRTLTNPTQSATYSSPLP